MRWPLVQIQGSPQASRALRDGVGESASASASELHRVNEPPPLLQPWADEAVTPDVVDNALRQRGRGAVAGLVLRSLAQHVVHLAEVPVTLVK